MDLEPSACVKSTPRTVYYPREPVEQELQEANVQGVLESLFPELYIPSEVESTPQIEQAEEEVDTSAVGQDALEREPPGKNRAAKGSQEKKSHSSAKPVARKGKPEPEPEPEPEPVPEPEPEDPDPYGYDTRLAEIESEFEAAISRAEDLERSLLRAEEEARQKEIRELEQQDEDFTERHRKTGAPLGATPLSSDEQRMAENGLSDPRKILSEYAARMDLELGPPRVHEFSANHMAEPHYMLKTNNVKVRLSEAPDRGNLMATNRVLSWHTLPEAEVKRRVRESEARRREQGRRMNKDREDVEFRIIDSMRHRLTFLRNPRFPPSRPPGGFGGRADHRYKWGVGRVPDVPQPMRATLTGDPSIVITAEPPAVNFTGYEAGGVYSMEIRLRNMSNVLRRVRLLPPKSPFFHVSLVRYPKEHGYLAPGMHALATVVFTPDSLADFEDFLTIDTELKGGKSSFKVPLTGTRRSPELTLPQTISLGEVMVGNEQVSEVGFENLGGDGCLKLVSESDWPHRLASAPADIMEAGVFRIWPAQFHVASGQRAAIYVSFWPFTPQDYEARFYIVADNCHARECVLRGEGTEVEITVNELDGRALKPGELNGTLWFGEVDSGSSSERTLTVQNVGGVALPFVWQQTERKMLGRQPRNNIAELESGEEQNSDAEQLRLQQAVRDELDLTFLDAVQKYFFISPDKGRFEPGQSITFTLEFRPFALRRYEYWMQLMVDTAIEGTAGTKPDTLAVEIGLEGTAAPLEARVAPRKVDLRCTPLLLGHSTSLDLVLQNPSEGPAHYSFSGMTQSVSLAPVSGVLSPGELAQATLTVKATSLGFHSQTITMDVQYGPSTEVSVLYNVQTPRIEMLNSDLDFGLVQVGTKAQATLNLHNGSGIIAAWNVLERLPRSSDVSQLNLKFEPQSGAIQAGGYSQVVVSCNPKVTGALRSTVVCETEGKTKHHLNVRADVVEPCVRIEPSTFDLGTVYEGVSLTREFRLLNRTQLGAAWEWDPVIYGVGWEALDIKLIPRSGFLQPFEETWIDVTYTPKQPMASVEIIAGLSVQGCSVPVGLRTTAEVCGLDVHMAIVAPGERSGLPKRGERVTPLPRKEMQLDFGLKCPLGQTQIRVLVLRNNTAIPAQVRVWVDKFASLPMELEERVPAGSSTGSASRSASARSIARSAAQRVKLGAEHERLSPFSSKDGRDMMVNRRNRAAARRVLGDRGLAISCDPGEGTLQPWGELRCVVACATDMLGVYHDTLHVLVGSLPRWDVPLRLGAVGTPLELHCERRRPDGLGDGRLPPHEARLRFGDVASGTRCEKPFHVRNTSSLDMLVSWEVLVHDAGEKKVDVFGVVADEESGTVRIDWSLHAHPAESPFSVEPAEAVVRAGASAPFRAAFCSEGERAHNCRPPARALARQPPEPPPVARRGRAGRPLARGGLPPTRRAAGGGPCAAPPLPLGGLQARVPGAGLHGLPRLDGLEQLQPCQRPIIRAPRHALKPDGDAARLCGRGVSPV
uniref:Deleted in lung and esophageal cancer protein 1 n=1 Tax=Tetraselmis sp. GSL018 TaxID=582737 RepID=A0A061QYE1_9CHLO